MKKFVLSLIALCCFAPLAVAQQDSVVEEIVARVNNAIITRADLRRNQEQSAQDAKEQNLTPVQVEERKANSLRDLIDQQLLLQKASELGISADADLVKRLDDLRKEMKAGSMEDLQKIAESQGVSWEEFKQNTKNALLTQKVIGSEVGGHIQITSEDIQKFYDEHKSEISQPERIRLSEILVANDPKAPKGSIVEATPEQVAAAKTKADDIYQRLKAGAHFDEVARSESNGTTAADGGDLGYFKRNDLAKQLEDQTFALKAGEFTQPIHTRQGFIILLVNDHIEAGTPPLDRIRDQIQDQLYRQRIEPALRLYLTKLREDAYIDVHPGYTDAGASANETQLVYTTDSGPRTKQVRGKLGMGKKKTVLVVGREKNEPAGSTSELGLAKTEVDAKAKAATDRKAAEEAAEAKAAAEAAEKEKLSRMTPDERSKYRIEKKREAKKEAQLARNEKRKQKELAERKEEEEAQSKSEQAKTAKSAKKAKSGTKETNAAAASQAPESATPSKPSESASVDEPSAPAANGKAEADMTVAEKVAAYEAAADKAAKAKASVDAAERYKLSLMTREEREKYYAKKRRKEQEDARLAKKEAREHKELAAKGDQSKAAESKPVESKSAESTPAES